MTNLLLGAVGVRAEGYPRIAVQDDQFVVKDTGEKFTPMGVNFTQLANDPTKGLSSHSAFCPTVYDPKFAEKMMADLQAHGLNTVRVFLSYGVGEDGIVASLDATEINKGYLDNVVDFLRAAQRHNLHVIFTCDVWIPGSNWLPNEEIPGDSSFDFDTEAKGTSGTNSFFTVLSSVRTRANIYTALMRGIRLADPELLKVVLAWEIQNEASFDATQEPFKSEPTSLSYAGKTYDLSTDQGAQDYMDDVAVLWCNFNVHAIQHEDPDALVSLSVFTFAAVGRQPHHFFEDKTQDNRVPVRPEALLKSNLSFIDIHVYAQPGKGTVDSDFKDQMASVEFSGLLTDAQAAGKPILAGETGEACFWIGGKSQRNGVTYNFDYQAGGKALADDLARLKQAGFAGALVWHYGWKPETASEDFPLVGAFPEYEDVIRKAW